VELRWDPDRPVGRVPGSGGSLVPKDAGENLLYTGQNAEVTKSNETLAMVAGGGVFLDQSGV